MDIGRIAREGCHVGHAGIHVGGAYGVTHGFVLFGYGFVGLAVSISPGGMSALVEEELGLLQIFSVARGKVQACQCHFGNLMTGYTYQLAFVGPYGTTHTIGITDGNVQKVSFSGGLVVCHGAFDHVSQVVELMTQFFYLLPAVVAGPGVRMLGVHGAGSVEVTVRFLCRGYDG